MNTKGKLCSLIEQKKSKDNDINSHNIGVIGEYGSGKSTYIQNELTDYIKDNEGKYQYINISLMTSSFNSDNIENEYVLSSPKGEKHKLEKKGHYSRANEVELLNKMIAKIKYSLLDREANPKFFELGLNKEKINKTGFFSIIFGALILVGYILFLYTQNVYLVENIPTASNFSDEVVKWMLLFLAFILITNGIYLFFISNTIRLRKVDIEIAKLELSINEDSIQINFKQYEEYVLFLIDKNKISNCNIEKYIFVFEDVDRVAESFLMNYLRELNIFLNENQKDIDIYFIYAIRNRLFEKLAKKKVEAHSLIKQFKFFDDTIIIKPYGDAHVKDIYNDIATMELASKEIDTTSFFTDLNYEQKLTVKTSYKDILEFLKECNLEYDLDFRTYKKMVSIIYAEANEYKDYLLDSSDMLQKNFGSLVFACILRFNVKNSYDFCSLYLDYILDDRRSEINYITDDEVDYIISQLEYRIQTKWPKKEGESTPIFANRERKLLFKFVKYNYLNSQELFNNVLFPAILGIDYEQRYFSAEESEFSKYYTYPLSFVKIIDQLQVDDFYINELIKKPNKYLLENYYSELIISLKEINEAADFYIKEIVKQWITKCINGNSVDCIINKFLNDWNMTKKILREYQGEEELISSILSLEYIYTQINLQFNDADLLLILDSYLASDYRKYNTIKIPRQIIENKDFRTEFEQRYKKEFDTAPNKGKKGQLYKIIDSVILCNVKVIVDEYNTNSRNDLIATITKLLEYKQNYLTNDTIKGRLKADIDAEYTKKIKDSTLRCKKMYSKLKELKP